MRWRLQSCWQYTYYTHIGKRLWIQPENRSCRERTQRTQRELDLKISPAAIFVVFVFIIHRSGFAYFGFARGLPAFRFPAFRFFHWWGETPGEPFLPFPLSRF